jgi:hypothetical protein
MKASIAIATVSLTAEVCLPIVELCFCLEDIVTAFEVQVWCWTMPWLSSGSSELNC